MQLTNTDIWPSGMAKLSLNNMTLVLWQTNNKLTYPYKGSIWNDALVHNLAHTPFGLHQWHSQGMAEYGSHHTNLNSEINNFLLSL